MINLSAQTPETKSLSPPSNLETAGVRAGCRDFVQIEPGPEETARQPEKAQSEKPAAKGCFFSHFLLTL